MPEVKLDSFGLPPAGHEQRETLIKRTDNLEEQAEEQYADRGAIPHDHDALNPERNREIRSDISKSYLEIGTNHPLYITKWVNYVNLQGTMVWSAKADGWIVSSTSDFPEAAELTREDNTIRIGDVLLMHIPKDKHLLLAKREENKRLRQQFGVEADIHDLAEATNRKQGQEVFKNVVTPEITGVSDDTLNRMEAHSTRQKAARSVAANSIGNRMKKGTIPGVPIR